MTMSSRSESVDGSFVIVSRTERGITGKKSDSYITFGCICGRIALLYETLTAFARLDLLPGFLAAEIMLHST
jgi:hypothetical protein